MQGQLPFITEDTDLISNSSTNNSVSTSTGWVFPTILVGCLQHQPLLVEPDLNDSAVGRMTQGRCLAGNFNVKQRVPSDFSSKKKGKKRPPAQSQQGWPWRFEGSRKEGGVFHPWEISSFLKKGFLSWCRLQLSGTHIHEIHVLGG